MVHSFYSSIWSHTLLSLTKHEPLTVSYFAYGSHMLEHVSRILARYLIGGSSPWAPPTKWKRCGRSTGGAESARRSSRHVHTTARSAEGKKGEFGMELQGGLMLAADASQKWITIVHGPPIACHIVLFLTFSASCSTQSFLWSSFNTSSTYEQL